MNKQELEQLVTVEERLGNLVCFFNDENQFSLIQYKILKSHGLRTVAQCRNVKKDGKTMLIYSQDRLNLFAESLSKTTVYKEVSLLINFMKSIKTIEEYNDYLNLNHIILSDDMIFYEEKEDKIILTFLPTVDKQYENYQHFYNGLVYYILGLEARTRLAQVPAWVRFKQYLQQGMRSLDEIIKWLSDIIPEKKMSDENKERMELVLNPVDSENRNTFYVRESDFVIGRKEQEVNGALPAFGMVSSKHCSITFYEKNFLIKDLNSINGTYLNEMKLEPEKYYTLTDGARLRIANLVYECHIRRKYE